MYAATPFWAFFLRGDTIAFWKMSLLQWLTKLTHQTLYREKITGEVLWRQLCHGDWTLKTVSEIAFCIILATGFKWIVIRPWFMETILVPIIIVSTFISIIVVAVFIVVLFVAISVTVLVFFLSLLVLVWLLLLLF